MTAGVRGDLIQWARTEQELTMRWVRDHGGPSLGYQSEVEHCKKDEVRSGLLGAWVDLLKVTEPFARGQIKRYADDPDGCRGLAADVSGLIARDRSRLSRLAPLARSQEVLRLVADRSGQLPRIVLAYVLGLGVQSLDAMLVGDLPLTSDLVSALAHLTTVPESFLRSGSSDMHREALRNEVLVALGRAVAAGADQEELIEWADEWADLRAYLPAIRHARQLGLLPEEIIRRLSDPGEASGQ